MKSFSATIAAAMLFAACATNNEKKPMENPLLVQHNVPVEYAKVTADHLTAYADITVDEVAAKLSTLKSAEPISFDNTIAALDDIYNKINIASNNCYMLYWVSPDSLSRVTGLAGYQRIDSISTAMFSDKALFERLRNFQTSEGYNQLQGHRKSLVDQFLQKFKQTGANLSDEQLAEYKRLTQEINALSASYSTNMNASNDVLVIDEKGAAGLSENFKKSYETGEMNYTIPVANATREPVMSNAQLEETRKAYHMKFFNRASDKNLTILDEMVRKRHELAQVMGYKTYAEYSLDPKMAKNPETVWAFINDLVDRSKDKALKDVALLRKMKKESGQSALQPWDISFFNNEILKKQYQVDNEKVREYLPMEKCLKGVFGIYQELLGLEFRKVENPSVWHKEVEMYEVYEDGKLKGRFYLDLFPRPNKESWFYAVNIAPGRKTPAGEEVPIAMLLGNFTRPTESLPSLLSHNELNTLFHEFGHIMNAMSYDGEFAYQSNSKDDFVEAMSQIFENWIWDYKMLSSFAQHYQTGEVLPKETFDNMVRAKNVSSGLGSLSSLRRCVYDMNLYDKYNPASPMNTDDIWKNIDKEFGVMPLHVDGTHTQASWIHINTHPVYMYGYLWSEVYAQDMFTVFEKNGLTDQKTGKRYRKLILANGTQRDIVGAVEEFLGRPSNNEAYIKSLGLN